MRDGIVKMNIFTCFFVFGFNMATVYGNDYALMPPLFQMDNFDQCMLKENEALYCTFTFNLHSSNESHVWKIIQNFSSNPQNYDHEKLRHGVCVPTTCPNKYLNNSDLREAVETCYDKKYGGLGLYGNVSHLFCQNNDSKYALDVYDYVIGAGILLYICFVIICSILDSLVKDKNNFKTTNTTGTIIFKVFSIGRNWTRLVSTKAGLKYKKLQCIQGIRFYNMVCVIMSHTVMGVLGGPLANPQFTEQSTKKVLNMFLANGWYVVQTFFVISGWLMSYHFFKMFDGNDTFKYKYLIGAFLHRYIRLAAPLAIMTSIHATWLVHASRGPYWDLIVGEEHRNCRKNWWTNVLFINNYVDNANMCLHQTWYIASDMQLFVFSLIILVLCLKFKKYIKVIFGLVLTIGLIIPGLIAYIKNYDIVVRQYPEYLYNLNLLKLEHWHVLYSSAYSNIFGYTIGMVFGYLFFKNENAQIKFSKIFKIFWWILTFGMCISVVLVAAIFYDPTYNYTRLESAIYWSLGKNLFALGLAIGVFGFAHNIGWIAKIICEFYPLQVLGRLTYSAYLVHVAFIKMQMGYRRYPFSANDNLIFLQVVGNVVSAYLAGLVLCLFVEMPVSELQKSTTPAIEKESSRPSSGVHSIDIRDDYKTKCTKI